ncbi:MAG: polymerase sigma-70 factor, subfamily [Actinomycetota bacterium]|jgi:RNA polymerase sigma-70 factor (ECF subfamily)|nr:polymerase sigma-70 factor, subfamily [Actinomycetota bacterium]MDQ1494248.1 polymerase sigma-70 factor, subfamily [Actinomycetota bacterium]
MAASSFEEDLSAAQGGDESAFATLWRNLNPGLVRYLRVVARPAAEDLASETWLQIIRSLGKFRGDEQSFRAWVFTIARNKVTDWRRHEGRRPTEEITAEHFDVAGSDDTEQRVLDQLSTEGALNLIATLPLEQAEIIMLRVVAGLDVAAVAKLVHKSEGAVRVSCHRALTRLRDALSQLAAGSVTR